MEGRSGVLHAEEAVNRVTNELVGGDALGDGGGDTRMPTILEKDEGFVRRKGKELPLMKKVTTPMTTIVTATLAEEEMNHSVNRPRRVMFIPTRLLRNTWLLKLTLLVTFFSTSAILNDINFTDSDILEEVDYDFSFSSGMSINESGGTLSLRLCVHVLYEY